MLLQKALLTERSQYRGADTSSRKSTVLALFTLWLFWFLVFADANGASVIVTGNVKFSVSTGNAVTEGFLKAFNPNRLRPLASRGLIMKWKD